MIVYLRKAWVLILLLACTGLMPASAENRTAAAFSLKDATGVTVSLADFAGKPVVLHFWATWCPYCKKLQPGLDSLQAHHAAQDLVVLAVSFREDEGAEPQAVLERRGLKFKTLLNGDEVATTYGVRGTPTTFFINGNGQIVGVTNTSDPADGVLRELAAKAIGDGS